MSKEGFGYSTQGWSNSTRQTRICSLWMGVMAKYADKHYWCMLIHPKSSFKSDRQTISTIKHGSSASPSNARLVRWNITLTITIVRVFFHSDQRNPTSSLREKQRQCGAGVIRQYSSAVSCLRADQITHSNRPVTRPKSKYIIQYQQSITARRIGYKQLCQQAQGAKV